MSVKGVMRAALWTEIREALVKDFPGVKIPIKAHARRRAPVLKGNEPMTIKKTIRSLKRLRNRNRLTRGLLIRNVGICSRIEHMPMRGITCHFETWPKFSGNTVYPVPGGDVTPNIAFKYDHKWNQFTEYGRLRLELLNHLITELEKEQC